MILLIYPKHSPYPHSISAPLSIFCLGSFLEQKGIEVEYFDERVQNWSDLDYILKRKPLIAGISVMTSYQIKRAIAIASYIRHNYPGMPMVWGGIHPTACPHQTLESGLVDFVIKGEAEEALYDLVCALENCGPKKIPEIENLAWKEGGMVLENKNRRFLDLNSLPFPYSGKAAGMFKIYFKINRGREGVAMETSRGCNFACRFCYNPFFNQSVCRAKTRQKLEQELSELDRMGVRDVLFVDDNLGVSRHHIKDLCELTGKYGIRWSGGIRTDILDEALIESLEKGCCRSIFFGIESVNPQILKYINKNIDVERITDIVHWIAKTSVVPVYSFMTGLPGEDKNSLKEQFEFVDFIRSVDRRAEIAIQPYNPVPGTALYEEALRYGFRPPDTLSGWWRMTTGETLGPWVKREALLKNLYLVSFLAFRSRRFLHNTFFLPLHILARLRWKTRFFGLCAERVLYIMLIRTGLIIDELFNRWFLFKKGLTLCR